MVSARKKKQVTDAVANHPELFPVGWTAETVWNIMLKVRPEQQCSSLIALSVVLHRFLLLAVMEEADNASFPSAERIDGGHLLLL